MTGVAAIAFVAAFTSCSKSNDVYDQAAVDERKQQQEQQKQEEKLQTKEEAYQVAFENEFGKIDPNQNWGFTDQSNTSAATRGANVNRNEWGKGGNTVGGHVMVPENVTNNEYNLVLAEFSKKREGVINQVNVNWTDYMVTQVHKGTSTYTDGSGGSVLGSDKMNHFQALKGEGSIDQNGNLVGGWEHVNDFNSGDQNTKWGTIEGHTYMENSGTMDFAYHNSVDSKYHNEYIIIAGADIDESLKDYYYVGFDFYATHPIGQEANKNMDVDRDWIFNDWIVRISPAQFMGSQRVFVEDLITNDNLNNVDPSDWDFNDAVFDAFIYYNQYWTEGSCAVITLRAAGGTLPLTIAGNEVHSLFGVEVDKMVNTGMGPDITPVQFRIPGSQLVSGNANDIPVIVTSKSGDPILLTAKVGSATQKLAAPIADHVKWLKEKVHIKNGYPTFMDYVNNASLKWYDPANQESLYQKWY